MGANEGQTVLVHYRGTLADGSEFDSSRERDPLEFTVGSGDVIPGFDEAVRDLEPGESKTVTIPAASAYGERTDEALQEFPKTAFPEEPEVGWMVELQSEEGQRVPATVAEVGDELVVLDFNHPLAGQDLTFEIELLAVQGS
jgi:peptidylprolyl isomerase